MTEWWMLRATSTSASRRSRASVFHALLVGQDRRRAPAVVARHVLVEHADDRAGGGAALQHACGDNHHVARSVVRLPSDVRSPFDVYVNGVRQELGEDYRV